MEKSRMVEKVKEILKEAKGVYFLDYQGITTEKLNLFRKKMKESGCHFLVVKNRLAAIGFQESGFLTQVRSFLKGPTSLLVSPKDEIAPAHLLKNLGKEFPVKFKGALVGKDVFDRTQFDFLASIPPKEELFANLVSALLSPITQLAFHLENLLGDLVLTLEEIAKKKNP
jgi:large subunit ribosomal protein L10